MPGGRITPGEDPATRAVISVAQSTGLRIADLQFAGEYAGRVSVNQVFVAEARGSLQPNRRHIEDARWWDVEEELPLQDHVTAILELVQARVAESDEAGTPEGYLADPHTEPSRDEGGDQAGPHDEAQVEEEGSLADPHVEGRLDSEGSTNSFDRLRAFVAVAGLALWTGLKALFLALRVAGTGMVYGTDGVIAVSLTFQGTRPRPVPRRSFPKGAREALGRAQGHRCIYCGVNLRSRATHIDHIKPLAQQGTHTMDNWQLLCHRCNLRKGARDDEEFRYRFRALLSPRQGAMPAQTIRQRDFDQVAQESADAVSYQNFRAGKYYTPGQKVNVGGIVAGVVVGGLLFWLLYGALSPEDPTPLALVCAALGGITWVWIRLRAWYTGRDRED